MTEITHGEAQHAPLNPCACGGLPYVRFPRPGLFTIKCARCPRETEGFANPVRAAEEWNDGHIVAFAQDELNTESTESTEKKLSKPPCSSVSSVLKPADDDPRAETPTPIPPRPLTVTLQGVAALTVSALVRQYGALVVPHAALDPERHVHTRDIYALAIGRAVLGEVRS